MRMPWRRGNSTEPEQSTVERVEQAKHDSVTEEVLEGTVQKRWLRSNRAWLHEDPLIDYLEDGEQPHFVLTSELAIETGVGGHLEPEPPYQSFCCITDENAHLIAGRKPENGYRRIEFSGLIDFGVQPGEEDPTEPEEVGVNQQQFTPTLRFRTTDEQLEFHVTEPISDLDIEEIGNHVASHTSANSWGYSDWWISLRKQRLAKWRSAERERQRREEERAAMRREEERRQQRRRQRRQQELERLAGASDSGSVTVDKLDPIYDSLADGETVEFILTGGRRLIGTRDANGKEMSRSMQYQNWTAVTPLRIITRADGNTENLEYGKLRSASVAVVQGEPEEEIIFLDVTTDDLTIRFDASEFTRIHLQDLVNRVRDLIGEADAGITTR